MISRNLSFIVKTVNGCNLSCEYCYAPRTKKEEIEVFPIEYVKKILLGSIELGAQNIQFVWHGSEPTLAGIDYFTKVHAIQEQTKADWQCINNVVQTNGTLLSNAWIRFFEKNHFGVGISIDGPAEIHDENRRTRSGKPTHGLALKSYLNLKQAGCDGGICAVISRSSIKKPVEIVNFFSSLQVPEYDLLPCYYAEINDKSQALSIEPKEFGEFLIKAFDRWIEIDNPDSQIRTFETIITLLMGGESRFCQYRHDKCNDFFGVDTNGDVYPCDLFVPDDTWRLGSLSSQNLFDIIFDGKNRAYFKQMVTNEDECRDCKWFSMCWGGCTHHRYLVNKDITQKSLFCETRKMLFEHISKTFELFPSFHHKLPLLTAKNAVESKDFEKLPALYVDVGHACNAHCYFCAADSNSVIQRISDRFDESLDASRKLKLSKLIISGGEATIIPDLLDFITKAKDHNLTMIHLQTNGIVLSDPRRLLELINAGVKEFGFSIHGHNKEIQDLIAGVPGSFTRIENFLTNLNFIFGGVDLPVTANVVITPENLPYLCQIAQYLIDFNVSGIKFSYLHGIGRGRKLLANCDWPSLSKTSEEVNRMISYVERVGKKNTTLSIEAIPMCMLPDHEIYSSDLCIDDVYLAEEYSSNVETYHSRSDRQKGGNCRECSLFHFCLGPWKEYIDIYGDRELKPIFGKSPDDLGLLL